MNQNANLQNVATGFVSEKAVIAQDVECCPGCWIGPDVEINSGTVIGPGAVIGMQGPNCPAGKVLIGENVWIGPNAYIEPGAVIGSEAFIGPFVLIKYGVQVEPRAYIGTRCTIMDQARIGESANLIAEIYICEYANLGAHCQISPGATLVNDRYPPTSMEVVGPTIGECAVLGVKSVIWPGVKIGYHAMVASLSEVKEDVQDYVLVRGCPAKSVCDVRQIRMKHEGKWVYPYPWMRINTPGEDITKPDYDPKRNWWKQQQ